MKIVTSSRINAIENGAAYLKSMDGFSGLSDAELEDHYKLGQLLEDHAKEVVKLLISLNKK